ncbi:hypothetical protein CLIM01_01847 [Colletotrichum limetticola]|nr:hypothetical protein CLIM01_01847 [Colletotrichum limetticola]
MRHSAEGSCTAPLSILGGSSIKVSLAGGLCQTQQKLWAPPHRNVTPSRDSLHATPQSFPRLQSQLRLILAAVHIFLAMAPGQKAYPRGTVKKIIKAHSNCNLSKNVDVMIYLDYVLFMQTLVKEAAIESKKSGERGITARSVKKVTSDTLTKFRG